MLFLGLMEEISMSFGIRNVHYLSSGLRRAQQVHHLGMDGSEGKLCGLIAGLYALHQLNCCHGDLKTDNILVFTAPTYKADDPRNCGYEWQLQLTDFGIARIHKLATKS